MFNIIKQFLIKYWLRINRKLNDCSDFCNTISHNKENRISALHYHVSRETESYKCTALPHLTTKTII